MCNINNLLSIYDTIELLKNDIVSVLNKEIVNMNFSFDIKFNVSDLIIRFDEKGIVIVVKIKKFLTEFLKSKNLISFGTLPEIIIINEYMLRSKQILNQQINRLMSEIDKYKILLPKECVNKKCDERIYKNIYVDLERFYFDFYNLIFNTFYKNKDRWIR